MSVGNTTKLTGLIALEAEKKLDTVEPWEEFGERINSCKQQFWEIVDFYRRNGCKICCLGASTKGNVTLQTWEIGLRRWKSLVMLILIRMGHSPGTWIPLKMRRVS